MPDAEMSHIIYMFVDFRTSENGIGKRLKEPTMRIETGQSESDVLPGGLRNGGIPFFDANCDLGAPMNDGLHYAATVADLYAEMDRMGVGKALVKYLNVEDGAAVANERLAKMLDDDADHRLLGVWNILPEQCDEQPHGDAFFDAMKAMRIVALRHLAAPQRWVPCRLTVGDVMDGARERRIPLLTSHRNYADDWAGLYRFIQEFPENIFIVIPDSLWGTDRQIRPLLENFPGVIRDIARKYGAHRIVYGSGFPAYNQGNMMSVVRNLELDEADRRLIASGNLERLISEERL